MTRTARCVATIVLTCCTAANADDFRHGMPRLYDSGKFTWKHVDGYMSAREYRESSQYNQRMFGRAAHNAFKETLASFGISKRGAEITGPAVGLSMTGASLNLDEHETLSFEVSDVTSDDRSVFFNFKLDW